MRTFVSRPDRSLAGFTRDRRGSTIVMASIVIFVVMGFAALAVDLGSLFVQKRRQQTANDLAALAAASDLTRASAAAQATLTRNQLPAEAMKLVEVGVYTPNAALTPAQRFVPGNGPSANAVRVTLQKAYPIYFAKVFSALPQSSTQGARISAGASNTVNVNSTAIAAANAQASFAVGSRLLSINGGIINGVLGGMLGTNLSLTAMDYQALANAKIDMFTFSDKLASRLTLTGLTYSQVLSGNVQVTDALNAALDASRANPSNSSAANAALALIVAAKTGSFDKLNISNLLSAGVYSGRQTSQGPPVSASLNALQFVSAMAQIANGTNQVAASLGVSLPGISSVSLKLTIGERPVGTSLVTIGSVGATAHTAQTRVLLSINLIGTGSASVINLPIYIEVASATARITAISCSPGDITTSSVTLGVTPGIVDAWIGNVTNADMTNFSVKPNPPVATLVNLLNLVSVTGRAHATMSNMTETPVTFSYADITGGVVKTTSTTSFITPLLVSLTNDLKLSVNVLSILGLGLGGGLDSLVLSTVIGATSSIDTLISGLLNALGVSLGQADTWVTGIRCGNAVLVN
ncbi:MAG: hypothetical protein JWO28_1088 [Hyphomicrobiales bacterium]|nr:hypothetical protein [Hyphomicrobiales bacterium]